MRFDVKCVKNCLTANKLVFTVRSWSGCSNNSYVNVEGVGRCLKTRIMQVTKKEDLLKFVPLSGFSNVEDWWTKIVGFGASNGWLFRVEIS